MIEPVIGNLRALANEIAAERAERFGSEHLALAMDSILFGPAYYSGDTDHPNLVTGLPFDNDPLAVKLDKLCVRARAYLAYDQYLVENGFQGNREIDAAIIRQRIWNAHKSELEELGGDDRILAFLSLICKTNGLFLGREVLNRDFTFYAHGPVFDMFVQKDPYKSIPQQDPTHKIRLLEMSRGSYKSTSDGVDTVQWIIVKPDIRIMFLTATLSLAKDFVKEVKNYFMVDSEAAEPTPFQHIFAADFRLERPKKDGQFQRLNFLIAEKDAGKETEFICPARTKGDKKKKEVTIWAGSVGAGKVGKHCDVLKADDAVDEKNTDTPKLIQKTKKRIGMASKLVDPGGYKDNLGTPYAPNDWYNHIRLDVKDVLTLIRPCKWLRRDVNGATAIERGQSILGHEVRSVKELVNEDWTLHFPVDKYGTEKLSYKNLEIAHDEDQEGFPSQYMLDPSGYKKVSFPEALLYQQSITRDQMPAQIEPYAVYMLWDLADTQGTQSDFSVGSVLEVDREGRGYVTKIYRDKYTFHDLCFTIAKANHDHKPIRIIIENARGAEKLKGDMQRAALDMGDKNIPLDFIKVTNTKAAKAVRIGKLEPKLRDRMLFFLTSIECYEDLVAEFRDFGSASHDDIPDCIGFCEHILSDIRSAPKDPHAALAAQRIMNEKQFYEMIHGSPEQYIEVPIEPLPDEGTGTGAAGDLWDPFSATPLRR